MGDIDNYKGDAIVVQITKTMLLKEDVAASSFTLTGRRNLADLCWALTGSVAAVDHN